MQTNSFQSNIALILRGQSGAGKSYLAKTLEKEYGFLHVEADQFFINSDGSYYFHRDELTEAHNDCLRRFTEGLLDGYNVVVSNTFIRLQQLDDYIKFCREFGFNFIVIKPQQQFPNVHGVSQEIIDRQLSRYERFSREFYYRDGLTYTDPTCKNLVTFPITQIKKASEDRRNRFVSIDDNVIPVDEDSDLFIAENELEYSTAEEYDYVTDDRNFDAANGR